MTKLKRILSILLSLSIVLSGCGAKPNNTEPAETQSTNEVTAPNSTESSISHSSDENPTNLPMDEVVDFSDAPLNDPDLLRYIEDSAYSQLVSSLDSTEYFVENVQAIYISKEYLQELEYNSRANVFFGYTLSDLDKQFRDTKYVFTLGSDGQTTVQELEEFTDDTDLQIMKNVAIGAGVILLCVVVTVVTEGAGAPAACAIFAASAKTGAIMALSGGVFGGVSAGIVKGIQTHDMDQALKAAALAGSEGFKWGAISGAIIGGVSEGTALYGAAKQTNFKMNQYATIQQETGYPLDVIKEFHTMDEYSAFAKANLKHTTVGNKSALIKTDIDLTRIDAKGRTNLERMRQGLAPLDKDGISYELHHIGQRKDGTLAILTQSEHDNPAIHGFLERTEAHAAGTNWDAERQAFWKAFAKLFK